MSNVSSLTKCDTVIRQLIKEEGIEAVNDAIELIRSNSRSPTSVETLKSENNKLKSENDELKSILSEISSLSSEF